MTCLAACRSKTKLGQQFYLLILFPILVTGFQMFIPKNFQDFSQQKSRATITMTSEDFLARPKLIVFDLDATLWHPEMFQLRGGVSQDIKTKKVYDARGVEVQLCSDVGEILHELCTKDEWAGTQIAVASRTNKPDWAARCLEYFRIGDRKMRDIIRYKEIYVGNKVQHFGQIRKKSGVSYDEMLFFDDWHRNCADVGRLGVVTCTVNKRMGLTKRDWNKGLRSYAQRHSALQQTAPDGSQKVGTIKWFNPTKGYGFITPLEDAEDIFVHASELIGALPASLAPGDEVKYQEEMNAKNGKLHAVSVQLLNGNEIQNAASSLQEEQVSVKCFSMAQPFASILLHGHKTIESRNNPMFEPIRGTVALQVGRKDWRDKQYLQEFEKVNMAQSEVNKLTRLPNGFKKGCIVGLVDIGETIYCPTEELTEEIERAVVASGKNVGRYLTYVTNPRWLKYPVPCKGSPGVFNTNIPRDAIADENDSVLMNKISRVGIEENKIEIENELTIQF